MMYSLIDGLLLCLWNGAVYGMLCMGDAALYDHAPCWLCMFLPN